MKAAEIAHLPAVAECDEEQAVVGVSENPLQQKALYESFKRVFAWPPDPLIERRIECSCTVEKHKAKQG